MCGRYSMAAPTDAMKRLFDLGQLPDLEPRYNLAPSQLVPAVIQPQPQQREFRCFKWGLVPFWAKDPSIGNRLINARSETAAGKPAFRVAMRYRRCLLPADGFYEWKKTPNGKQPVYAQVDGGALFAFAGLWESWQSPEGQVVESSVVLTCRPNEKLKSVHDRMPVILPKERYEQWLDPACQDGQKAAELLKPFDSERMQLTEVSKYVNSPANEGPDCIEPMTGELF